MSRLEWLLKSDNPDVARLAEAAWGIWLDKDPLAWDRFRRLMVELLGEEGKP